MGDSVSTPAQAARASVSPIVFTQPDTRFRGHAYRYVRAADRLPDFDGLGSADDPLCRVKLFLPAGAWTYYIAAVTRYDDETVMTGLCVSAAGSLSWGDSSLDEIARARAMRLPVERDLHFRPMRRSKVRELIDDGSAP